MRSHFSNVIERFRWMTALLQSTLCPRPCSKNLSGFWRTGHNPIIDRSMKHYRAVVGVSVRLSVHNTITGSELKAVLPNAGLYYCFLMFLMIGSTKNRKNAKNR